MIMSKPFPISPRYAERLGLLDRPGIPVFNGDPPEDVCGGCLNCIAFLDMETGRQVCSNLACGGADPRYCQVCHRWRYRQLDYDVVAYMGGWQEAWRPIWEVDDDDPHPEPAFVWRLCWAASPVECHRYMRVWKRLV